MKLLINLILVLCCVSAQAASVRNYLRNPFTNEIDTNALIVTKISTNILADGGVIAVGRPQRFPFSPYTNTLAIGFYSVSNINLRSAYVINVDDASSTLYDCTNLLHSGFNTYVVVQPTFSRITNALGYLPATNGSSGGVNVTGAQLAATTTNAGVVTVSVPTNSVVSVIQQQFAAGSNTFTGTATLSGFSASGNLNMNINGGTITAGANTMSPSGFSTTGGILNPTGFAGSGYGLSNIPPSAVSGVKTNYDLKHDGTLDSAPVNPQELKRLRSLLYNRQKATLSFVGDSTGMDIQPVIESALLPFVGRAGAIGVSTPLYLGNYMYLSTSGTATYYPSGLSNVFWGAFAALGNGATLSTASTTSNGISGDQIGLAWVSGGYSGAGTFLLETQQVTAGVWGTLRTLSSASGSYTMLTTNVSVPYTNYNVRITSTGSNMPVSIAIRDTRSGAGFISSATTTPGVSPIGIMQGCGSNNVANYLLWQDPDVIFYKAERQTTITNELPWFDVLVSNTLPACDMVFVPYHYNTDAGAVENREFMIARAKQSHRAVADVYAESLNFFTSTNNGLYQTDGIHLKNVGASVLHARVPAQLGIGVSEMLSLGYSFPSTSQTNDTSKASLAGGNNFTGNQVIGGYLQSTGSQAAIVLNHRNDNTRQTQIYGNGNGVFFSDSAESNPWMVKSNASGTMSLNFTPYGGAAVFNIGNSSFLRYWGDGGNQTNLQSTNLVAFQASVFPTNAIPPGSATVTNIGLVPWRGKLVFVATNLAAGGWMWQTNGPSGAPVWGAFNPASQP